MTKKQYLQPELLVSKIQSNTVVLIGSPVSLDSDSFGIGGGLDPFEAQ